MKVKELMAALQGLDPDEEIYFTQDRHDYGQTTEAYTVEGVRHVQAERLHPKRCVLIEDDYVPDEDSEIDNIFILV